MAELTPHDLIAKPFASDFLRKRLETMDERVAKHAANALYNLALTEDLPGAVAAARVRVLHLVMQAARGNVSEGARRVGLNRTQCTSYSPRDSTRAFPPQAA
jgi:DNA-binding protein Fis